MRLYGRLVEIIDGVLEEDVLENNKDVISMHYLYHALEDNLVDLRELHQFKLKDIINKDNRLTKLLCSLGINVQYSRSYCSSMYVISDGDSKTIVFHFKNHKLAITRIDGKIVFDDINVLDDKNFIIKYHDLIMKIFDCLDKYKDVVNSKLNFSDGIFDYGLDYYDDGMVASHLSINREFNEKGIANFRFNSNFSVNEYINNNKEELFKRLVVRTNSLNPYCSDLIFQKLDKQYVKRR